MMAIEGSRKVEQSLQQAMQARRQEKILAPDDIGYALQSIVDNNGDVVACTNIFARERRIAPNGGLGRNLAHLRRWPHFMPDKFVANSCKRRLHVNAKRGGLAGYEP